MMKISHGWKQKNSAVLTDRATENTLRVLVILAQNMGDGLYGYGSIQKGDCSGKTFKSIPILYYKVDQCQEENILLWTILVERISFTDLS